MQMVLQWNRRNRLSSEAEKILIPALRDGQMFFELFSLQPAEYAMFHHFNQSLWHQIAEQPEDFWSEVRHFRRVNRQVQTHCHPICKTLQEKPDSLGALIHYRSNTPVLRVPASDWNHEFGVDVVDCVLMVIHKGAFRNWFVTKQFPELCSKKERRMKHTNDIRVLWMKNPFESKGETHRRVALSTDYCRENDLDDVKYDLPLLAFSNADAFDWTS